MSDTRTVARTVAEYTLTFPKADVVLEHLARRDTAQYLRAWGKANVTLSVTLRDVDECDVVMCFGCQARPALWEYDVEGAYATSTCGECDWWACVEARNAERVRACRRKSTQHDEMTAQGREHNCYAVIRK